MSNKSPYELRTEILSLAKDYMDKQYEANREIALRMVEIGTPNPERYQDLMTMYSPDQLLDQATKFYENFVCQEKK